MKKPTQSKANKLDRTAALKERNLEAAIAQVKKQWLKADKSDLLARYEVARIAIRLKDASRYGEGAWAKVDKALGLASSTLYRYAKVAELWPRTEFLTVISLKTPNGLTLSWSHMEALVAVKDRRKLSSMLKTAVSKSLSVRDLQRLVEVTNDGDDVDVEKTRSRPGPTLLSLTTPIERSADLVDERLGAFAADATRILTESELSDLESLAEKLDTTAERLVSMSGQVRQIRSRSTAAPLSARRDGANLLPPIRALPS